MRFTKMQGCGNDYIYINCFEEDVQEPERLAVAMSERHFGVGADGLVLILPSETGDFRMRMFNLDGSEGEMCGNAVRCIGKYVYERGMTQSRRIALETAGGIKFLELHVNDGIVETVTVDMGAPVLEAEQIPVKSGKHPVIGERLRILDRDLILHAFLWETLTAWFLWKMFRSFRWRNTAGRRNVTRYSRKRRILNLWRKLTQNISECVYGSEAAAKHWHAVRAQARRLLRLC